MRNPNGYGGVIKLAGKRRKPYCARVTDRWEEIDGKKTQKYKPIGYFKTQKEALSALDAYNNNSEVFIVSNFTFADVYERWSAKKYDPNAPEPIADSNIKGYKASYKICESIKNMKMSDIKAAHLQEVVDKSQKNEPILKKLKTLLTQMYSYAMANDIVNKDYAQFVVIPKSGPAINRIPFTEDEVKLLWERLGVEWVDTLLIQIYTGMRIGELLSIENENVFLDKKYMIGGKKTEAGIDRIIPLHNRILPLIEKWYSKDRNMLILENGAVLSYDDYRTHWDSIMWELHMSHLPHDCRHTFISLAKKYKLDSDLTKRIIGHKTGSLTFDVYTHTHIEELLAEINKLP